MSLKPSKDILADSWHFLDSLLAQTVLMEGLTQLQLPNLPHRSPHTLPTCPSSICVARDITVVVKKVAKIPVVLAS